MTSLLLMPVEPSRDYKGLSTFVTAEGFLSRMPPIMNLQISIRDEPSNSDVHNHRFL